MFEYNQTTVFFTSNRHLKMCCVEVFVSYIHLEEMFELIFKMILYSFLSRKITLMKKK